MLIVDPDQRPTAEELVLYIEQIGKTDRPVSSKIREKERRNTDGHASLLRTIEFTDSMKDLQMKLPRHNYMLKAPPKSHNRSLETRMDALPELKANTKMVPKYTDRRQDYSADYENRKMSTKAKEQKSHRSRGNIKISLGENESSLERFENNARHCASYEHEKIDDREMKDTKFLADYDRELSSQVKYINVENSVGCRLSPKQSTDSAKKRSSRGSSGEKRSSMHQNVHVEPFDDIKIEENVGKGKYEGIRRHRTEANEERSVPSKPPSKYHMNHKINISYLNASTSVEKEKRSKRISEDYAKMVELEKKKKRLYKLLVHNHNEEINDMLKMHRRHRLYERHNSSSVGKHHVSYDSAAPSKYSKLPVMLINDKSGHKQKGQPRPMLRNYHDQYKNSRNYYGGAPVKSVQPRGGYHNPDWWG